MSVSLKVMSLSPVFNTTTTTWLDGVRNAVHSRLELLTMLDILTEPRGTYLLEEETKKKLSFLSQLILLPDMSHIVVEHLRIEHLFV